MAGIIVALALIASLGAGLTASAQDAKPTNLLYIYKTHVVEPVTNYVQGYFMQ